MVTPPFRKPSNRNPLSAFEDTRTRMSPAVPPQSVQAGETGGSNMSDLTDDHCGRTRNVLIRERSTEMVSGLVDIADEDCSDTGGGGQGSGAGAGRMRGVLDAEVTAVGPAPPHTSTARSAPPQEHLTVADDTDRQQSSQMSHQPDLMDDNSSTDSELQRQLTLGLTAASPEVGARAPMPKDVGELLRRAQSQSGGDAAAAAAAAAGALGPPPIGGTAPAALGGPDGGGPAAGSGALLPPPPPQLASALRGTSRGRESARRNMPSSARGRGSALPRAGGLTDPFLSDRILDDSGDGSIGVGISSAAEASVPLGSSNKSNPRRTFGDLRRKSSSTLGSSCALSSGDPNLLESLVPNPPTPTGSLGVPTRSRSMGLAPPSHFPTPLGRIACKRSMTDESSNRPHRSGGRQGTRSTVTFEDIDIIRAPVVREDRPVVTAGRPLAAPSNCAAFPPSGGSVAARNIDSMSREERDRLLREFLSGQQTTRHRQQRDLSSVPSQEPERPHPEPEQVERPRHPGAVPVLVPATDARVEVPAACGDDDNIDPAIVDMVRRQEEAALRLSLAESGRRGSASEAAAESARAAMSESDDQMLTRAIELSRKETSRRAITGTAEDTDDELRRVLELSRQEVGGRPHKSSNADEEDEEMKMALNISLQDTGGRQYLRGGPRSSVADVSALVGGISFGEVMSRQTSIEAVTVSGAGVSAVNGVYILSGTCNSVNMYSRKSKWQGRDAMFTLYRCFLDPEACSEGESYTPRLWFISIVPPRVKPGTDEDRDFYVARGTENIANILKEMPPENGWAPVEPFGMDPSPACKWKPPSLVTDSEGDSARGAGAIGRENTVARVPEVQVYAAGSQQVNGVYKPEETSPPDVEVTVYVRESTWDGEVVRIHLFRSQEDDDESHSDAGKRWFLSIVPAGCLPGSSADTDLYIADEKPGEERLTSDGRYVLPPAEGWKAIRGFGLDPPPVCLPSDDDLLFPSSAPAAPAAALSSPLPQPRSSGALSDMDASSSRASTSRGHSPFLRVTDENNETHTRKVAMCIVCRTRKVTHILVPCGHPCLCEQCADYQQLENMDWRCPIGRCKIERVMRFYGTLVEDKEA